MNRDPAYTERDSSITASPTRPRRECRSTGSPTLSVQEVGVGGVREVGGDLVLRGGRAQAAGGQQRVEAVRQVVARKPGHRISLR